MKHTVCTCDMCLTESTGFGVDLNSIDVTTVPGYVASHFDLCTPCLDKLFAKVPVTPRKEIR